VERRHPDLARAAELLTAERDVVLAIAYGSLVNGRAHAESDLDVGVWTEAPLTVGRHVALVRALALTIGRAIDLVDLRTVGVPLSQTILCDGTVLVRRDERLETRRCASAAEHGGSLRGTPRPRVG
jgi:predicted nucleotidyltransferase